MLRRLAFAGAVLLLGGGAWLVYNARPAEDGADPRAAIQASWPAGQQSNVSPDMALREERPGQACLGYQIKLEKEPEEANWAGVLLAASRSHCLSDEQGDALAAWAATREPGLWAGPRAEWLAYRGDLEGAKALLPQVPPDSRLRVLMRGGSPDGIIEAAEEVLIQRPGTILACRMIVNESMRRGDLFRAVEESACSGVQAADLQRLRGIALDAAGQQAEAEQVFRDSRSNMHLITLLYQEEAPGVSGEERQAARARRVAEALELLAGETMPIAQLHRGWMGLRGLGPPIDPASLESSPDTAVLKAAILMERLPEEDLGALGRFPGSAPKLMQARIYAALGRAGEAETAVEEALRREPLHEPTWRGAVGVWVALKKDPVPLLSRWLALDPDHVTLRGGRERREIDWAIVAPWSWADLHAKDARVDAAVPPCGGTSPTGEAYRKAVALPTRNERLDALEAIQRQEPDLRELAAIRYRLEAGL